MLFLAKSHVITGVSKSSLTNTGCWWSDRSVVGEKDQKWREKWKCLSASGRGGGKMGRTAMYFPSYWAILLFGGYFSKLGFPCKLLSPGVRFAKIFFFWFPVSPPGEVSPARRTQTRLKRNFSVETNRGFIHSLFQDDKPAGRRLGFTHTTYSGSHFKSDIKVWFLNFCNLIFARVSVAGCQT